MEYVISVAAAVWCLPFLGRERGRGGWTRFAWRFVGLAPLLVLDALAVMDRFSTRAFAIGALVYCAVRTGEFVWSLHTQRRATRQPVPPGRHA
jgi:hypothetical protein